MKRAVRTKTGRIEAARQILPSRDDFANFSSCRLRKLSTPTFPMTRIELIPETRLTGETPLEERKIAVTKTSCRAASDLVLARKDHVR